MIIARFAQRNPIDIQVGNRVRIRRMLIGMSQERLGDLLGLTFQRSRNMKRASTVSARDGCSKYRASSMCRSISFMKA